MPKLGVNIDHVATSVRPRTIEPDRSGRGTVAGAAGADGITIHLQKTSGTFRIATCVSSARQPRSS